MRKGDLFRLAVELLALIGLLALLPTKVSAVVTGKIGGTIVDARSREPLPNVSVIVQETALKIFPKSEYFKII